MYINELVNNKIQHALSSNSDLEVEVEEQKEEQDASSNSLIVTCQNTWNIYQFERFYQTTNSHSIVIS